METYTAYKSYGILYNSLTGTTSVDCLGLTIARFEGCGRIEGERLAKESIDWLLQISSKTE